MAIILKEFSSIKLMEDYINGLIVGQVGINPVKGINLRGKTLVFTTPVKTVTFPDTFAFEAAKPNQVIDEINTQMGTTSATLRVTNYLYQVAFIKSGDVLTGGTAVSLLGLPSAFTVGASAIAFGDIGQIIPDVHTKKYILLHQ